MKAFAEQLRAQQKKHGMTQEQFSKFLGISVSALSCYVLGKKVPSLDIVAAIAEKLGITIGELCGETATGMPKTVTCADAIRQIEWLHDVLHYDFYLDEREVADDVLTFKTVQIHLYDIDVYTYFTTKKKLAALVKDGTIDEATFEDLMNSKLAALEQVPLTPEDGLPF